MMEARFTFFTAPATRVSSFATAHIPRGGTREKLVRVKKLLSKCIDSATVEKIHEA